MHAEKSYSPLSLIKWSKRSETWRINSPRFNLLDNLISGETQHK